MDAHLAARVEDWITADPDAGDRAELRRLLAAGTAGDAGAADELRDRFSGPLRFGTAGLRGRLRAGENGMNTAVVRRVSAGFAAWLTARDAAGPRHAEHPGHAADSSHAESPGHAADASHAADAGHAESPGRRRSVVVGYDARHGSEKFAVDSAGVFAAAGLRALLLPGPLPTPVLAFAVRHLDAEAGVMVTASHNPATDNGYKVYLGGPPGDAGSGVQIVPPADMEIESAIRAVGPANQVRFAGTWTRLGPDIVDAYVTAAAEAVPPAVGSRDGATAGDDPKGEDSTKSGIGAHGRDGTHRGRDTDARDVTEVTVAYTPLHGVGADVLCAVFERAGLRPPLVVDEQRRPDPDFPTAAFPNPEEPGVMDRVVALGDRFGADVVLANDPDADRCAVAVGAQLLSGDEVGLLLADYVLRRCRGPVATTVVSSTALRALAADVGVPYTETLTGFKWIMRADPGLVFGYEEALGYAVAPGVVRDKDGITAALAVARIAAEDKRRGRTLLDRLDDLARRYGVFATAQVSVHFTDLTRIDAAMRRLRATPPSEIGGEPVTGVRDLVGGGPGPLPPSDVLLFDLAGGGRVALRPSGTEPKLKAYLEAVAPVGPAGLAAARAQASARLGRLRAAVPLLI